MEEETRNSDAFEENMNEKTDATIDQLVQSKISGSGNSNVNIDIKIQVDVKPIAFAIIYSLFATDQLTEQQLKEAMEQLESLH